MSKTFSTEDVASHSKGDSIYIIIDEDVYDVSKFQDEHPGELTCPRVAADTRKLRMWRGAVRRLTCDHLANILCAQVERRVRYSCGIRTCMARY